MIEHVELKNGGPAFPNPGNLAQTGATLRDYFAAAALHGLMHHMFSVESRAHMAYEQADAMLKERSK